MNGLFFKMWKTKSILVGYYSTLFKQIITLLKSTVLFSLLALLQVVLFSMLLVSKIPGAD